MLDAVVQAKRKKLKRLEITAPGLVAWALTGLRADWAPHAPSWCYAWCREVFWHAGVSHETMPKIATARLAFAYYQSQGWALPEGTAPIPGDLLFKVSPLDGSAGHVGIFTGRGLVSENSTAHIDRESDGDARGQRPVAAFAHARVVRPPYKDGD